MKKLLFLFLIVLVSCETYEGPYTKIVLQVDPQGEMNTDETVFAVSEGLREAFRFTGRIKHSNQNNIVTLHIPQEIEKSQIESYFNTKKIRIGFWETFPLQDVLPLFIEYNKFLKSSLPAQESAPYIEIANDSLLSDEEKIAIFNTQNPLFAILEPHTNNINPASSPIAGLVYQKDMVKVDSMLNSKEAISIFPQKMKFVFTKALLANTDNVYSLIALKESERGGPAMNNRHIKEAKSNKDGSGRNVVSIRLTPNGGAEFLQLTERNVYKAIAITIDGRVTSYPIINEPIQGGNLQISGDFTEEEAITLASQINRGILNANITFLDYTVIDSPE